MLSAKELQMRVVVFMNVTLDGVIQAPGRPDEDVRGGCQWPFQSPHLWPGESPHLAGAQSTLSGTPPPRVRASRIRNDSPAVTSTTAW